MSTSYRFTGLGNSSSPQPQSEFNFAPYDRPRPSTGDLRRQRARLRPQCLEPSASIETYLGAVCTILRLNGRPIRLWLTVLMQLGWKPKLLGLCVHRELPSPKSALEALEDCVGREGTLPSIILCDGTWTRSPRVHEVLAHHRTTMVVREFRSDSMSEVERFFRGLDSSLVGHIVGPSS